MTAPGEAAGDMPLTGHLAELRKRILYSLAAVLAGTVICLFFIQNLISLMTALSLAGLVQGKTLKKGRKFIILGSFILAAVITPTPDILTQSLLALPAIGLYEISLHFIGLLEKAKNRRL